jgi:hypothetical protein
VKGLCTPEAKTPYCTEADLCGLWQSDAAALAPSLRHQVCTTHRKPFEALLQAAGLPVRPCARTQDHALASPTLTDTTVRYDCIVPLQP